MPLGTANFSPESSDSSIFGIPLDVLNRSRFENWAQSGDDAKSVSAVVGGLNEFIGDENNRWLRCLVKAESFNPSNHSKIDSNSQPSEAGEADDFQPIRNLSPIVLYGETGTGKTSLALSLIARVTSSNDSSNETDREPACLAGSEFYRRYVAAMDRQTINEFRQKILSCSGLVIDNIDQLESKPAAQRELVYLIDQLNRVSKPIIITMQYSPLEANHLVPQLLSRLSGGIGFPVFPPGLRARRKIIELLQSLHRIPLTAEAAEWVAQRMSVSVPKLNHFFVQLKTELKARDQASPVADINPVDMVMLGLIFQQDKNAIEAMTSQIIDSVADEFEMTSAVLCSNSRKQTVVMARGVAIWLLRTMLGSSYQNIGTRFGGRDHTTILHAFHKYDGLIQENAKDPEVNATLCSRIRILKQRLDETFAGEMTLIP
jgi:chromosomal replication initiator protein